MTLLSVSITTNSHLKDWINSNGATTEHCSFGCAGDDVSVDVLSFARHVDTVIRQNYSPNSNFEEDISDEDPESALPM